MSAGLQFFAADHLARTRQEHGQYLEGLFLEFYPRTIAPKLPCIQVHFENTELDRTRPLFTDSRHIPTRCFRSLAERDCHPCVMHPAKYMTQEELLRYRAMRCKLPPKG